MENPQARSGRQGSAAPTFETRHDIDKESRARLVTLLNERLADTMDLYSQTKHAHWNVKGNDFYQLHTLFDELAEIVEGHADTLAERATALGGYAKGTVRMAARDSTLPEMDESTHDGMGFVEALADRYAQHGRMLREGIDGAEQHHDKATADLFTQLVRDVDKALYFLESHLQRRR